MKNKTIIVIATVGAVIGLALISASNAQGQKFGMVDIAKLADDSIVGKREKASFEKLRDDINDLLTFISTNRVMTREQSNKLEELWLKEEASDQDTTELDTLKGEIEATSQRYSDLVRKTNPTADEVTEISEKSALANATQDRLGTMNNRFLAMMQDRASTKQIEVLDKARAAVKKVGQRDGYNLIFDSNVAVYASNDVTAEALKIMDEDNP